MMTWNYWDPLNYSNEEEDEQESHINSDFSSLFSTKDYYSILEVGFDASEETIRSNYIRLALKWHPDKKKEHDSATSRFQEINEAYRVLSHPVKRREHDINRMVRMFNYNVIEYLDHYKGLILTCNGLGIKQSLW